jgi:hypothetical protein
MRVLQLLRERWRWLDVGWSFPCPTLYSILPPVSRTIFRHDCKGGLDEYLPVFYAKPLMKRGLSLSCLRDGATIGDICYCHESGTESL